jgi:hypothetical protein
MNPKPPAVVPWSYSSLTAYETCPKRYYLTRIAKKVSEPQTEATIHGNDVHKSLEMAIKGERPLPPKHEQYQPIVEKVTQRPGQKLVEFKFGLTAGLKPTTFFAKDVWVRGVIDFGLLTPKSATALDWKTGKPKSDADQLKLFAGVMLQTYPYLDKVKTGYVWLAYNKMDTQTFSREEAPDIWQDFSIRVHRMERSLKEDDFPPRPSGLCRAWCPVGRSLCEFCGKD